MIGQLYTVTKGKHPYSLHLMWRIHCPISACGISNRTAMQIIGQWMQICILKLCTCRRPSPGKLYNWIGQVEIYGRITDTRRTLPLKGTVTCQNSHTSKPYKKKSLNNCRAFYKVNVIESLWIYMSWKQTEKEVICYKDLVPDVDYPFN